MVGDSVNDFCVHNYRSKSDEVWGKFAHFNIAKENWKSPLLIKCDAIQLEQNCQRILINLFIQPMTNFIQNVKRKANNLLGLRFQKQFGFPAAMQIRN